MERGVVVTAPIPTALSQLVELLSSAIHAMESTSMEWERKAIAARWLEFELAPALVKLDLGAEVDGIAQRAVEAYKKQRAATCIMLPIDSMVPVAELADITARPQLQAVRIDRIIIPSDIAPLFVIEDIRIGNQSQLRGALPAVAFAEGVIAFDVINTSMDFAFTVRYTGDDPTGARFRAVVRCEPVTDEQIVRTQASEGRISSQAVTENVERQRALLDAWHSSVRAYPVSNQLSDQPNRVPKVS
jgi:hypothetical protein